MTDYLQEAIRNYEKNEAGVRNLNLANAAAAIAQVEALRSIAVSLAALVELGTGGKLTDTVGDGDFTDEADMDMDVPF